MFNSLNLTYSSYFDSYESEVLANRSGFPISQGSFYPFSQKEDRDHVDEAFRGCLFKGAEIDFYVPHPLSSSQTTERSALRINLI